MRLSWLFSARTALRKRVFSSAVRFLTFFLHFMAFSPQSKVTTPSSMEVARRTSTKRKVMIIARGKPDISAHQGRDYLSSGVGEVEELAFRTGSVSTAVSEGKSPGPNLHNVDPSFLKTTRCNPKRWCDSGTHRFMLGGTRSDTLTSKNLDERGAPPGSQIDCTARSQVP